MKRELREAIELDKHRDDKGGLSKLIEKNKGIVKALGIASFIALAGYSTAQLLKDKKLMKKIREGLKTPNAIKYIEDLLSLKSPKSAKAEKKSIQVVKEEKAPKIEKAKADASKKIAEKPKATPKKAVAPAAPAPKAAVKKKVATSKPAAPRKKSS